MKIRIYVLAYLFVILGIVAGCAQKSAEVRQEGIISHEPVQELSIEEQRKQAYTILKEVLLLSDSPEREKKLPEMKALYREIIYKYPDLGLAQESYLRLVILAKEENTPEGDAEAESLYREFLQKYPESQMQGYIENELQKE